MGQRLSASGPNPAQPGTFFLHLVLICDGDASTRHNPIFQCITSEWYGLDYMAMRAAAHANGWRRRNGCWYSSCCCKIPKGVTVED